MFKVKCDSYLLFICFHNTHVRNRGIFILLSLTLPLNLKPTAIGNAKNKLCYIAFIPKQLPQVIPVPLSLCNFFLIFIFATFIATHLIWCSCIWSTTFPVSLSSSGVSFSVAVLGFGLASVFIELFRKNVT